MTNSTASTAKGQGSAKQVLLSNDSDSEGVVNSEQIGLRSVSRLRRQIRSHIVLTRIVMIVFLLIIVVILGMRFTPFLARLGGQLFFVPKMVFIGIFGSSSSLASTEGRTNILFLGTGGAGHEAPELTDTILFISLDSKGEKPVFLSLPRDVWIPSLRAKINTAYYYGNQKKEGGGIILARDAVSEILDQPVHYAAVLDFGGFVKLIDILGGVDVDVERAFDDFKYPIAGRENDLCGITIVGASTEYPCRYEHLHFDSGLQTMDGQTALKFVRSRNAEGEEGTDFARASRQQKVLAAIKQKLLSREVIFNIRKIQALWETVKGSIETDIPQDKLPILTRMFTRIDQNKIVNAVLDGGTPDSRDGLLINPPISPRYDNQWVLVPRDGTWEEIRRWVSELF